MYVQLELDKVTNCCGDVGRRISEGTATANLNSDVRSLDDMFSCAA